MFCKSHIAQSWTTDLHMHEVKRYLSEMNSNTISKGLEMSYEWLYVKPFTLNNVNLANLVGLQAQIPLTATGYYLLDVGAMIRGYQLLLTAVLLAPLASAGPVSYGVCQAGCTGVVMACYSAAGFTWGATVGAIAPATIVACSTAFGSCQVTYASVLLLPIL